MPRNDQPVGESLLKRPFDFIVSGIGLLLSAPLWAIIALAIKLDDGGPIFYEQERWGKNGRVFRVRKFRTMVPDADARFGARPAQDGDPRITRVGSVLRTSGMDELPQLLTICRGDMSLVGPRALAIGEKYRDAGGNDVAYQDVAGFDERLRVRPGLTGLATIMLPKDAHPRERFEVDLQYVRHPSFLRDVRLVLASLWISVRGKWETRGQKI
ncbi:MAG TPA: sugar transferase [Longimicrobiales bacterium]|nr:sugar transferase [Longimicrobiales bacterium]